MSCPLPRDLIRPYVNLSLHSPTRYLSRHRDHPHPSNLPGPRCRWGRLIVLVWEDADSHRCAEMLAILTANSGG
ncbi:hypothetical protein [Frankia sp. R82]|uniref:hypothetical protein n=1 Tax=Frankia sp. R82 TaxID=2950553 RepID=UPI0020449771|nr:hypothetical protein [Frankia sp. R82]MCM3883509.1 hypothetical protein [Frankia sp. R82]